jgi:hypothetical protein
MVVHQLQECAMLNRLIALSLAAAMLAGAAPAENAPAQSRIEGVQPVLDVTGARPMLVLRNTQAAALRAAGIARTSVDHRFASDDVEGSFGFLCGLQPGQTDHGAAAAHGYDPQGRFLGAKLKLSF